MPRGRPRTPNNVRQLRGDTRPSRARPHLTAPVAGAVEPPEYLDDEQRAVWRSLSPSLIARGVLTPWDVDLFAAFCAAVVHHRRAVKLVNDSNVLLKGPDGAVKNPALQIVRDQAQLIATIGSRFGLTPADRARIALPAEEVRNDGGILD